VNQLGTTPQPIYVWDTQARVYTFTNLPAAAITLISISPNGQWLAAASANSLTVLNVPSNTSQTISTLGLLSPAHAGLHFSGDGHWLVASFGSSATTTNQVFLFDNIAQTNLLASQAYNSGVPAAGASDVPNISPDGRFVVFRSTSTNLVAGITNGLPNLFVYDRFSGATSLLSADMGEAGPSNNRSLPPVFSGDGRVIFFGSWASDLAAQDFNQRGDVFGFAFLYLTITASVSPGPGPTLSWPVAPGLIYQAQYKDHLSDGTWQIVTGTITITGNRGSITDLAPAPGQRFYRVVAQ